jgi:hypothetical protein
MLGVIPIAGYPVRGEQRRFIAENGHTCVFLALHLQGNALVFTAGANGNNSRADEHSNKDCAKNEVVRHNGGPFGDCAAQWPGRE